MVRNYLTLAKNLYGMFWLFALYIARRTFQGQSNLRNVHVTLVLKSLFSEVPPVLLGIS